MNTAILSSTIGGSAILVAAVVGALMSHFLSLQRQNQAKMEAGFQQVFAAIHALDTKFTGQIKDLAGGVKDLEIRLTDKFTELITGQVSSLDTKFTELITGQVSSLDTKFTELITGQVSSLDTKFTGQIDSVRGHLADLRKEVHHGFKAHGERLARIEVELMINPPPSEAA